MAISYTVNTWAALCRSVKDDDLSIDNNGAELSLLGVVVGRQSWLFFEGDGGGETVAVLRSRMVSCQQAGVEPYAYLPDALRRVADFPAQRVANSYPQTANHSSPEAYGLPFKTQTSFRMVSRVGYEQREFRFSTVTARGDLFRNLRGLCPLPGWR